LKAYLVSFILFVVFPEVSINHRADLARYLHDSPVMRPRRVVW
jgi:hypothetical protein